MTKDLASWIASITNFFMPGGAPSGYSREPGWKRWDRHRGKGDTGGRGKQGALVSSRSDYQAPGRVVGGYMRYSKHSRYKEPLCDVPPTCAPTPSSVDLTRSTSDVDHN